MNENGGAIFLQPTGKEEGANIIFSINSNKASGRNSIPYRALFLLKNEISKQLEDLSNLSFMTAIFPSVLKYWQNTRKTYVQKIVYLPQ